MFETTIGVRYAIHPLQLHGPLSELIAALGTGRACLAHNGATRHVWFGDGKILAVTSMRDDEKLGSWLVGRGLVPPQTMRDALASKPPGDRLGTLLVRRGALAQENLQRELEALSLTLLGRMTMAGGELAGEGGVRLSENSQTVDAPLRPLLIAAARLSEDFEELDKILGNGKGWMAADPEANPASWADLHENERYIYSLLKRPRTLDNLRKAALIEYSAVLRALAVLAVVGHIVPCKVPTAPPPSRPADAAISPGEAVQVRPQVAPESTAAPVAGGASAGRASLRDRLAAIAAEEASKAPMCDADGQAAAGPVRSRVEAMLASVERMTAQGSDKRAIRQILTRALDVFPAIEVVLRMSELELSEPHLRGQGLERLQRMLAKVPRCTEAWLMLARYWAARGQPDKTRACAAKVLAYEAGNEEARRLAAQS